jgi:hypothetical protein
MAEIQRVLKGLYATWLREAMLRPVTSMYGVMVSRVLARRRGAASSFDATQPHSLHG